VYAARSPPAFEVTMCVGLPCAALLALEVMPGVVYVVPEVPTITWLARVVVAPAPIAVELVWPANTVAPAPKALELSASTRAPWPIARSPGPAAKAFVPMAMAPSVFARALVPIETVFDAVMPLPAPLPSAMLLSPVTF
jgi:hypothetical protein